MSEQEPKVEQLPPEAENRYADLDQLQQEIARRIKDNQRFLERFMQDDFEEENALEPAEDEEEFEEL